MLPFYWILRSFHIYPASLPDRRETELNGLLKDERMQVGLTQLVSAYECADWKGHSVETQVVPEFARWKRNWSGVIGPTW